MDRTVPLSAVLAESLSYEALEAEHDRVWRESEYWRAYAADLEAEVRALEDENDALESELSTLRAELSLLRGT